MAATAVQHIKVTEMAKKESLSMFSYTSSGTYTSRRESHNLACDNNSPNYTWESKQHKNVPEPREAKEQIKPELSQLPIARKSHVAAQPVESGPVNRLEEHSLDDPQSAASKAGNTASRASDCGEKLSTYGMELFLEKRREISLTCSKYSSDKSTVNSRQETRDKRDSDQGSRVATSDVKSQSQKIDFVCKTQTYNCDAKSVISSGENGKSNTATNCFVPSTTSSKQEENYEMSELTLRLRGSMQSDFLLNELRQEIAGKSENDGLESDKAFRTIDEILQQYGMSYNKSNKSIQERQTGRYRNENSNVSQNNETVSGASECSDSEHKDVSGSSKSKESCSVSQAPSKKHTASPKKDPLLGSVAYRESKNYMTTSSGFRTNLSQNNETSKYGHPEDDLLRKYGSSVDYSAQAAATAAKYSANAQTNYGRYDYGKSGVFSGDTSVPTTKAYMSKVEADLKANNISRQTQQKEGTQVDVIKPSDASERRMTGYETLHDIGSSTDALEFSLSHERQRLRRLDTLITSTSVLTPAVHMPKYTTRFLSPQRDYTSLRHSERLGRIYSSPKIPSASYGTSLATKSSWTGGTGHHENMIPISKAASVPGNWGSGFQSVSTYGSSIDSRPTYTPYHPRRDYNFQYNNSSYNSIFSDRFLSSNKNFNKNHKQIMPSNPQNNIIKNKPKTSSKASKQKNNNRSRSAVGNASSASLINNGRNYTEGTTKSASKKPADGKKNGNTNDSKSSSSVYADFDFIKDLNRMWKETLCVKSLAAKAMQNQNNQKCAPNKANIPLRIKKEKFQTLANELFKKDNAQSTVAKMNANTRKANERLTPPTKASGNERDQDTMSPRNSKGQYSLAPRPATTDNSNQFTSSSSGARKPNLPSSLFAYQPTMMTKSIMTPISSNLTSLAVGKTRPSSVASFINMSRSHAQFPSKLPFQIYSTMDFYTPNRPYHPSSTNKTSFASRL